jgi:hypothetical protein
MSCAFLSCLIVLKMMPIMIFLCSLFGAIGVLAFGSPTG